MPLTSNQEFALKQSLSGDYLTEHIPANWESMTEVQQRTFISTRKPTQWQSFSDNDIRVLINAIHLSAVNHINMNILN